MHLYCRHCAIPTLLFASPKGRKGKAMYKRLNHIWGLLSFILISSCSYSHPQRVTQFSPAPVPRFTFRVEHVTDGKRPLNGITDITQSPDGLIWMAGTEELIRYDGYDLVLYRTPMTEPDAKAVNFLTQILVDHLGIVWTATRGAGLKSFNPKTEQFVLYRPDPLNPKDLAPPVASALLEDRNGALWIGTPLGLKSLDRERKQFARFADDTSETENGCAHGVTSILEDSHGTLWVGTVAGLSRFDRASNRFVRYGSRKNHPLRLPNDTVTALCEDGNGLIWVGLLTGELVRFDPGRGTSFLYRPDPGNPQSISDGYVLSLARDGFGNLWVASLNGGLRLLEASTGKCLHFRNSPNDPTTIQHNVVGRLCAEKMNPRDAVVSPSTRQPVAVIWLCYPEVGVSRIVVRKNEFLNIQSSQLGLGENRSGIMWSLTQTHNGTIWAGCQQTGGKGLLNLDVKSKKIIQYFHDESNVRSLGGNSIKQVLEDSRHNIWVITLGKLQRFDPARKEFKTLSLPAGVTSICEGRDGSLWLALMNSSGYVFAGKLDPVTDACISYPRPRESLVPPRDSPSLSVYEDTQGFLWIGTFNGGLYSFDKQAHTYRRFRSSSADSGAIKTDAVSSIVEDPMGNLWIGTHIGLYRFDRKIERFEYVPHPAYPNTNFTRFFIRGMVYDDRGYLWIASGPALSRFNILQRSFLDFGSADGLDIVRLGVIHFDREKRTMCVGGLNGLAVFHPDSLAQNPRIPTIMLTSFKIHEKSVSLPAPLTSTEKIEIPYSDNFFSFTFSAVDFVNPSENSYAYMMEGFDKDWVQSGNRRYASFTNLEPGSYVFRVKGANSDGVWNERGTSVQIIVNPPWYKSMPAYVSYAIVLAFSLFALERYYRRRLTLRHEMQMKDFESQKLREIDQIKSRFFANISHEFRTPLTLILGPIDRIKSALREPELSEDLEVMRRSGQRLLRLINRLLDLSTVDAGRMPLYARPTDLVPFLRTLVSSFVSHAERKGIVLKLEIREDHIDAYVDREKLEEIVTNLLSNAFKFTARGGQVTVVASVHAEPPTAADSPSQASRGLQIAVQDTGIGIPPDKLSVVFDRFFQVDSASGRELGGTGIGLALAKELVELHRGSLTVSSIPGEGSVFTVELPLGKEHLRSDQIIEDDTGATPARSARESKEIENADANTSPLFALREESTKKKPVVLVIEDNADVRRYLRSILDGEYEIEDAAHGEAGLAIAFEGLPDLVVSDIMMPRLDGIEVCRRLKTDERTSHIPIILLTARASAESKLEGLETGADDYITKPFDAEELRARVRNLIEVRLKLREKYRQAFVLGATDQHVSSIDEQFLRKVVSAIEKHLSEPAYETATLAYDVCMSRMNLNRKLQALTGHSTHDFIRTLRLYRAAQLLRQHAGNISHIAYEVGFSSVSHFAKAFHEQFGEAPSDFAERPSKSVAP